MTDSPSFQRVSKLSEVTERKPTFLAVGTFDGVHRGHQMLLQEMVRVARASGARPAVLTFYPHPREVIQGTKGRLYLTTLEERVSLLVDQGIELIITHIFDDQVRRLRADAFVEQLCRYLDMGQLWGGNFSLGYQREGNAAYLTELGRGMGFTVHELHNMVMWNGDRVSSSRVRSSLASGDIGDVNGGLGRLFCLEGKVIRGDQRGRTIGFPTANLDVWEQQMLPGKGVYATYAWLGEKRFPAATNVGVRPTINGADLAVEAHLLDFEQEIYGEWLRLEFVARVRDEHKFPSLEALKAQIGADVEMVRQLLKDRD